MAYLLGIWSMQQTFCTVNMYSSHRLIIKLNWMELGEM
ncbi:hypothetical protein LEMLEM_LOCUS726 [Lemmus lemmus]